MEVSDASAGKVVRAARVAARRESGWLALDAGLTALLVWIAVHGLAGVPPAVLWFAAGVVASDTARALYLTAAAVLRVHRLAGRVAR